MYVYQNYTVTNLNLYKKTGAWGTSKDSSATTVSYRYRVVPTSVSLDKTNVTFTKKDSTLQLHATITPNNSGDKSLVWKSSDTSVVKVTSTGFVTVVGNGNAKVTVTTNSGLRTATCYFTVNIATTGISLNKESASLEANGKTLQLTATVSPYEAANKKVAWSSSNTNVATVIDGKVVSKSAGVTVITASCGGYSDTCTITVYNPTTTYNITYNLNGGSNNTNPATYTNYSEAITLKNPTRSGYTFDGWYSDATLKTKVTQIKKGSTGNKTFYAKWVANKYNIKFNGNGSTSGSIATVKNRKYGSKYTLPSNTYKKKGYTFAGWNTKADGSGKDYANKAVVSNLSKTNGKTVTLYAQWKKTKYTITYHLNGGKNSSKNPSKYYVTTSTITLKAPTRGGYTFKGWYSDAKFKTKVTKIKKGSTGTKHLYAKWSATKYTIKYKLNGGKNSSKNPSSYTVEKAVTLKNPTRKGYVFKGWYTDSKFKNKVTKIAKGTKKNLTLYAKWKKK